MDIGTDTADTHADRKDVRRTRRRSPARRDSAISTGHGSVMADNGEMSGSPRDHAYAYGYGYQPTESYPESKRVSLNNQPGSNPQTPSNGPALAVTMPASPGAMVGMAGGAAGKELLIRLVARPDLPVQWVERACEEIVRNPPPATVRRPASYVRRVALRLRDEDQQSLCLPVIVPGRSTGVPGGGFRQGEHGAAGEHERKGAKVGPRENREAREARRQVVEEQCRAAACAGIARARQKLRSETSLAPVDFRAHLAALSR